MNYELYAILVDKNGVPVDWFFGTGSVEIVLKQNSKI